MLTNTHNQKDVAHNLDRAAARANTVGQYGATPKQCWYLASLLVAASAVGDIEEFEKTSAVLTKADASRMIGHFKNTQY